MKVLGLEYPLMARSGHTDFVGKLPLSGVKQTRRRRVLTAGFDPKQSPDFFNDGPVISTCQVSCREQLITVRNFGRQFQSLTVEILCSAECLCCSRNNLLRRLLKLVAREVDRKPIFFPLPFAAWHILARISEILPSPPLTRNQVELMEIDNVARDDSPGFDRLNIAPRSIEEILPSMLQELATGSG